MFIVTILSTLFLAKIMVPIFSRHPVRKMFPIEKGSTLIPFSLSSRGLPFFVFPFPHGSLPQGIKQEHPPFSVHGLGQLWLAHQRMSKNFIRTSRIRSILKDSPAFRSIF